MNELYRPEVVDMKAMLTQERDAQRRQGYAAEIELLVINAQGPSEKLVATAPNGQRVLLDRKQRVKDIEESKRNCYAAACKLQQAIDELGEIDAGS